MAALVFDHVEKGVHSFGASDTTVTIDLATTVDPAKTFVLIDNIVTSRYSHVLCVQAVLSGDGTQLTLSRGNGASTATASECNWHVIEFASGLTVQHLTGTTVNSNRTIPSPVDTSRSAIIFSYQKPAASEGAIITATVEFIDGSNYYVTQFSAGAITYTAQTIQFDADSGVTVRAVNETLASITSGYFTISPVDVETTLVLGTVRSHSASSSARIYMAGAQVYNSTTIFVDRQYASLSLYVRLFVIDFGIGAVRRGGTSAGSGTASFSPAIPAINDASQAIAFVSGGPFAFGNAGSVDMDPGYRLWSGVVVDEDTATFERYATGGQHGGTTYWQMMDWTGGDPVALPWPGDFREGLEEMAEGSLRAPQLIIGSTPNNISSVVSPVGNRPTGDPIGVFYSWPAMALDKSRNKIMFHGGGHADYAGNEVYYADLDAMTYGRSCLPSATTISPTSYYGSVGGPDDAPASSHQYYNTCVLEVNDRLFVGGGAAYNTAGSYLTLAGVATGPYLWDLSKNDPAKVGGAAATDVLGAADGHNGWTNLDSGVNTHIESIGRINSTNLSVVEDGKDVIYTVRDVSSLSGFRIVRTVVDGDADDPANWTSTTLYSNGGIQCKSKATFAEDFAGLGERVIIAWAGKSSNTDAIIAYNVDRNEALFITPTGLTVTTGMSDTMSLVYDPVRDRVIGTDGTSWIEITYPAAWDDDSWVLSTLTPTQDLDYAAYNNSGTAVKIHGKLAYWREHDVFIANTMTNSSTPTMWLYKPEDWSPLSGGDEVTIEPDAARSASRAPSPAVSTGVSISVDPAKSQSRAPSPSISTAAVVAPQPARSQSAAPNPVVSTGVSVFAGVARSVSRAPSPTVGSAVVINIDVARSVSRAPNPTVSTGVSVTAGPARSASRALSPSVSTGVSVFVSPARSVSRALSPQVAAGIDPFARKVTITGRYARSITLGAA